jgi:excisionase family DNA binding protein
MRVFTTGQVAKICQVAPRTVSKWCDNKLLICYRIPGGVDRRIPEQDLRDFLKEHGMPMEEFEKETR